MNNNLSEKTQIEQHLTLAKKAQQENDPDLAIKHFLASLSPKPQKPIIWVYLSLSRLYVQKSNFERAEYFAHLAFQLYPEDIRGLQNLATIAIKQKQWHLALRYWEKALEKDPKVIWALSGCVNASIKLGFLDAAKAYLNVLCKEHPNKPNGMIGLAKLASAQENWNLAFTRWDAVSLKFPEDINALKQRANALIKLRRFDEAQVNLQQLCLKYPQQSFGFIGLINLAITQKQWSRALDICNVTLARFPDDWSALRKRVRVFVALRCFLEAEKDAERLYCKNPHSPDGLLSMIEINQEQQQWELALQKANQLIEQFPDNIQAWRRKGMILMYLRHFNSAERVFKLIQENFPQKPFGGLGLVELAINLSDFNLARSRAEILCQRFPESLSSLFSLAKVYFTISDVENLRKITFKLIDNRQYLVKILIYKEALQALEMIRNNEVELAINCLQKAIESNDYSNNSILLDLVALEIFVYASQQNHVDHINSVLGLIYSNIRKPPVKCRLELTSIVYQLIGKYYQNNQQYALANKNYQKSLTINTNNFHSLKLLKSLMLLQNPVVTDQAIFSQENSGKVAIMIISCQKNYSLISFLKKHLYQRLGLPYFFVIGNPDLNSDWFYESNILYVKTEDDYNSLTAKVIKALECVYDFAKFEGIIKFDDDVWIRNISRFTNFISWLENQCSEDYFGRVVGNKGFLSVWKGRCYHWGRGNSNILDSEPYKKPNLARYCGGGEGYYLSQKSIKTIVEYRIKYPQSIDRELFLEDKYVGETLYLHHIEPVERNLSQYGVISDVDIELLRKEHLAKNESNLEIAPNTLYKAIKI